MKVLACIDLYWYWYVSCVLVCSTCMCVYVSVLCIGPNRPGHVFIVFSITHKQSDDQTARSCPMIDIEQKASGV